MPGRPTSIVFALLAGALTVGASRSVCGQEQASDTTEWTGRPVVAIEFDCPAPIDRQGLQQIVPFRIGQPLQAGDLDVARQRITATQLFTNVAVVPEPRNNGIAIVVRLA